jgi:adenylate cyclase
VNSDGTFLDRLRNAGITPTDSEALRLQKSLLFFATGLICLASIVWLLIYWQLGPRFSSNLPFALQLMLVCNLLVYLKTLNFNVFRLIQLSLFLFTPFVAQWSIGSFITASGISLWGVAGAHRRGAVHRPARVRGLVFCLCFPHAALGVASTTTSPTRSPPQRTR